jgi:hypothetical protein
MIFLDFDLSVEWIKQKTFLDRLVTDQLIVCDVTIVVGIVSFDLKDDPLLELICLFLWFHLITI